MLAFKHMSLRAFKLTPMPVGYLSSELIDSTLKSQSLNLSSPLATFTIVTTLSP